MLSTIDEEMFDVLDATGSPTGLVKPRRLVHRDGDWHRTVHVWLCNHQGEILLQRRSAQKESHPLLWDISAAGHIEAGSTSLDAAVREVGEELGLSIEPQQLQCLFTITGNYYHAETGFNDREFSDVYFLSMDIDATAIDFQQSEVAAVKFIPINEFKTLVDTKDPGLVPHEEEYRRLIPYLDSRAC